MSESQPGSDRRIGLALAGGGPVGAVYEIGALRAMDEALDGIDFNSLHAYVGVSAGAFIASGLANGMSPEQLLQATFEEDPSRMPFVATTFFTPAVGEMVRRSLTIPRLLFDALGDYAKNPSDQSPLDALARITRALPVGLFDNDSIREFLNRAFRLGNRTDDFRKLGTRLFVVATDLDSGKSVRFGEPGWDHVPISRAVQASTALPGLYPPVEIEGRHYVDGVLLKTLHASVALDAGVKLLICINPIVPVDTHDSVAAGAMRRGRLVHRGLPTVMSQTFRTLVHSRLRTGINSYKQRYPDSRLLLFEPDRDDYRMFFNNIFKLSNRRTVCDHAYRTTRRQLLERREELEPVLEAHGIRLRVDVLEDERTLWGRSSRNESARSVTNRLEQTLGRLEALLEQAD